MAEASPLLEEAARVWAKAQIVYESPSWQGHPPARALVEQLARIPECHDGLLALVPSRHQLVVAYTLQTLEMMGSRALAELPQELLDRRQQVTFLCGSFKNSMDLGGLARQIRKRARAAFQPNVGDATVRAEKGNA
jgi:hypothetical protein